MKLSKDINLILYTDKLHNWLKEIDPILFEELDLSKINSEPNKIIKIIMSKYQQEFRKFLLDNFPEMIEQDNYTNPFIL